jgi:hypothetical protein
MLSGHGSTASDTSSVLLIGVYQKVNTRAANAVKSVSSAAGRMRAMTGRGLALFGSTQRTLSLAPGNVERKHMLFDWMCSGTRVYSRSGEIVVGGRCITIQCGGTSNRRIQPPLTVVSSEAISIVGRIGNDARRDIADFSRSVIAFH